MTRSLCVAGLMLAGGLIVACGKADQPAETPKTLVPVATPAAGAAKPANAASLFPTGDGRQLVLDTCGSCHPVACTARGQRTSAQWDRIRETHADKVSALTKAQMDTLYTYLKANFNDTTPEPQIPAELLQQGCTPF